MSNLTEKVAVIVGASRGVGKATSFKLSQLGMRIIMLGRSSKNLEENAQKIIAEGGSAFPLHCDVLDFNSVEAAFNQITPLTGNKIDTIVYSTGIGVYGAIEKYSIQDWNRTITTNLSGLFYVTKLALPRMDSGHIIALASGAAKQGIANRSAYVASKFGMLGFMESLSKEVEGRPIKVCSLLTGSVLTDFANPLEEKIRSQTSGKKYLSPEDVANSIASLLQQSEHAWTQEMNLWPF